MEHSKFTPMFLLIAGRGTLPPVLDESGFRVLPQPASGQSSEVAQQLASDRPEEESSVLVLKMSREALFWRMAMIEKGNPTWTSNEEVRTRRPKAGFGSRIQATSLAFCPSEASSSHVRVVSTEVKTGVRGGLTQQSRRVSTRLRP